MYVVGALPEMPAPVEAMRIRHADQFPYGALLPLQGRNGAQAVPLVIDVKGAAVGVIAEYAATTADKTRVIAAS
jgi:hypothetical protein